MRLGVIFQEATANAHYRAIGPMRALERRGHRIVWPHRVSYADALAGVPDWDLLHVHQFMSDADLDVVRRLRAHGVAVVWDTDDDARTVPRGTETYRRLGGRRKLRRMFERTAAMAREAHLVTTTSETLAEIYREAGAEHVAVIENYLAPEALNGRRRRGREIVVGVVAANEHAGDLATLRMPKLLSALLRAHPDVTVIALGVDLKLRDPRYVHRPRVPFEQLLTIVREFDVALAPLRDTPFNRARSNVKLKEYAAAGAAWLASPVGPYVGMGEAQGGLLVDDSDWYDAIERLVLDLRRRSELAERGRAWAATQTFDHGAVAWESAFRAAAQRARREAGTAAQAPGRPRSSAST
ncbi:MAG TPA: hypothetical protein VFU94_13440 [Conexibacter sp.]|nr:hypothetical protein [Conexibacter sp.]